MNIERSLDGELINPLTLLGNGEFTSLCPDTCLSKRMVLHVAIHIYFLKSVWLTCGEVFYFQIEVVHTLQSKISGL